MLPSTFVKRLQRTRAQAKGLMHPCPTPTGPTEPVDAIPVQDKRMEELPSALSLSRGEVPWRPGTLPKPAVTNAAPERPEPVPDPDPGTRRATPTAFTGRPSGLSKEAENDGAPAATTVKGKLEYVRRLKLVEALNALWNERAAPNKMQSDFGSPRATVMVYIKELQVEWPDLPNDGPESAQKHRAVINKVFGGHKNYPIAKPLSLKV
jgi:hypothetical protein